MAGSQDDDKGAPLIERLREETSRGLRGTRAGSVEVIVGVPFHDEDDTLPGVVLTALRGLERAGLDGRAAVLAIGSQAGAAPAARLRDLPGASAESVRTLLLGHGLEGRGFGVRALLHAASEARVPLVLLRPDLVPQDGEEVAGDGFSSHWVERLLDPVRRHGQDLALARFDRHPLDHPVDGNLLAPLIAAAFGVRLAQPMPGVAALSPRMVRRCLAAPSGWSREAGPHGVDLWITLRALAEGSPLCAVPVGRASFGHEAGMLKTIFRQAAHVLFKQVSAEECCRRPADLLRSAECVGLTHGEVPSPSWTEPGELLGRLRLEFDHFDGTLFREVVPDELRLRLEAQAEGSGEPAPLHRDEWARALRDFFAAYSFGRKFHPDDIVDGLYPFFLARVLAQLGDLRELERGLASAEKLSAETRSELTAARLERDRHQLEDRMVALWPGLEHAWREERDRAGAYLPRLSTWELVPNVGVTVPQELERPSGGGPAQASKVYQRLLARYRESFLRFMTEELELAPGAEPAEVLRRVGRMVERLEQALELLLPGDLTTTEGARSVHEAIVERHCCRTALQLTAGAAQEILVRIPPSRLQTYLGVRHLREALGLVGPRDALALTAWTDRGYLEKVVELLGAEASRSWFELAPVEALTVDADRLGLIDEVHGTGALPRLVGRVIAGNHLKGWVGDYPRTWFVLQVLKRCAALEIFSGIWQELAGYGATMGSRVVASIQGERGRRVLSANNAFQNEQQRLVVSRLGAFAAEAAEAGPELAEAARAISAAASVYHLSITLPDGTFVPMSAWTWASFRHRGGVGVPTPLSSLVERDWSTRDFLTEYLIDSGRGDAESVRSEVAGLIADGKGPEDLGSHLLGLAEDWDEFRVRTLPEELPPPAGRLERPVRGPILEPIREHPWESRYVLNAAAVRLGSTVYILYRAFGDDRISRVGLAWSQDGLTMDGRLDRPIYSPGAAYESAGCEDPRVTVIGDRLYMLYTAFDGTLPQIAMASIGIEEFLSHRFEAWRRHGLGFPGMPNKDAVLYPEPFDGRYVVYHRIEPGMWVSYIDGLECPWPRTGHKVFLGPRPGMMWDSVKLGAGAQPLKTTHGWLNIYHGVDYDHRYRLGVLLVDLADPSRVIYRSPNPILEPEEHFEVGQASGSDYWVPHVVFTCGAVPAEDKAVLELDDHVLVYYGAADTVMAVARGRVRDLVPIFDRPEP